MNKQHVLAIAMGLTFSFLGFSTEAYAQHKGISFQAVMKKSDGKYPTESGLTFKAQILDPINKCILREEIHTGKKISEGYFQLVLGESSVQTLPDYNPSGGVLTLTEVLDNTKERSGLNCVDENNNIISTNQKYIPSNLDGRILRVRVNLGGEDIAADFNMRAVGFAVNSEMLNSKTDQDFINVNNAKQVTQTNLESIFEQFTKLNAILSKFNGDGTGAGINISGNSATATTAVNVSGVVAIANGGTGANNASDARTNLGLGSLAVKSLSGNASEVLHGDGTWGAVSAGGVAEIKSGTGISVQENSGEVTIGLTNVGSTGTYSKVTTDAQGRVTAGVESLVAADIPNLPAGKITSGTFADSFLESLSIDKLISTAGKYLDYKPNGVACTGGQTLAYASGKGWECSSPSVGGVTGVTATAPLSSSGSSTPNLSISKATASADGYLSSTDWTSFNNKQSANSELTALGGLATQGILQRTGSNTYTTLGLTPPLSVVGSNISLSVGTTSGTVAAGNDTRIVNAVSKKGGDTITASAAGVKPLVLKGAASQTANLFEVQNSANDKLMSVSSDGKVGIGTVEPESEVDISGGLIIRGKDVDRKIIIDTAPAEMNGHQIHFRNHDMNSDIASIIVQGDSGEVERGYIDFLLNANGIQVPAMSMGYSNYYYNTVVSIDDALKVYGSSIVNDSILQVGVSQQKVGIVGSQKFSLFSAMKMTSGTAAEASTVYIEGAPINDGASVSSLYALKVNSGISYFGGSVGVGTGTPDEKLHVVGNARVTGTVSQTSDIRYKRNIATVENPLEKILELRGVTYDWRRDEFPEQEFSERRQLGVLAQEVERQFPEAVNTDGKGYKSVNYSSLVAPLIEAVKELYSKFVSHEKQVAQQARQIASMNSKIEALEKENSEMNLRLERLEKALSVKPLREEIR